MHDVYIRREKDAWIPFVDNLITGFTLVTRLRRGALSPSSYEERMVRGKKYRTEKTDDVSVNSELLKNEAEMTDTRYTQFLCIAINILDLKYFHLHILFISPGSAEFYMLAKVNSRIFLPVGWDSLDRFYIGF